MPNIYIRKSNRGSWTEESLILAINSIINKEMSIGKAAKSYGIPKTTLRNRVASADSRKKSMGPSSQLGDEAEKKLAKHIKELQSVGFAPTRSDVRCIAYDLAESLHKSHTFCSKQQKAGKVWLQSFLRRNKDISVRKAEGLSRSRVSGMNRQEVDKYFDLLSKIIYDKDLSTKPGCIWNCDESGVQMNNDPGERLAEKGSKNVGVITSGEKGETISILVCCNAEGIFIPPYCIFKGVYSKPIYSYGAPPGTVIKMRKESAYISSDLFKEWFLNHFLPRKQAGINLLILDGHAAHMSIEVLELAKENNVIMLCLPSHTTHYLQPLDRAFFGPFKRMFNEACNNMMKNKLGQGRLGREDFGNLLSIAWNRSATIQNGVAAFRSTGVYPLNKEAIPDHAFLLSCDKNPSRTEGLIQEPSPNAPTHNLTSHSPLPSTSTTSQLLQSTYSPHKLSNNCSTPRKTVDPATTPTKVLKQISPIPDSLKPSVSKRKQSAQNLTDREYIKQKKKKLQLKNKNEQKNQRNICLKEEKHAKSGKKHQKVKKRLSKKYENDSSTSEDEIEINLLSDNESEDFDANECVECLEDYSKTQSTCDWIKCVICTRWLHESCSIYEDKCALCGRKENLIRKLSQKKQYNLKK